MKKFISVVCVLLACLLAFCAAGAEEMPENENIVLVPGEIIDLSLKISAKAAGMQAQIVWDNAQLELVSDQLAYASEFKKGAMVSMINPEPENGTITMVYLRQKDFQAEAMEVLNLSFRVREEAYAGMTGIEIRNLQLVDAKNAGVVAVGEGLVMEIVSENVAPEVSVSPEATVSPEPTPEILHASRLYFERILPAEPTEAPTEKPTAEPTATPTVRPVPTPTRPGGHIGGGSGDSSVTPTLKPTATPSPTPSPTIPSVVIGGGTPVPEKDSGSIKLKARTVEGGVIVELIAKNVQIGGLQAEIRYDADAAKLTNAAFSDAFLEDAMIQMINDDQPGRISLVYSNLTGYEADGSAVFTAKFKCEKEEKISFSLKEAKYTGVDADLSAVIIADQKVSCEIQPMDDLDVVEEDGVRIIEIAEGEGFSLTLDPGECVALRVKDHEIPSVHWSCDRGEIGRVSAEGLFDAVSSGLVHLSARSVKDGALLCEGRICVRNAQFGIPVEMISISVGDAIGETFVISSEADEAAYAARGIELTFRDGETVLCITGLLPEDMVSIPAAAFDYCGNLVEIDIAAENIALIESEAFLRCNALEKIVLENPKIEIQDHALPAGDGCALCVLENSSVAAWAAERNIAVQIIEKAGDEQ